MTIRKYEVSGADIVGGPKDKPVGPGPEIMAASTLEGNEVYNRENETLGSIRHIMLDVPRGQIAYAVLSRGGVLGIGDKMYAIPWSALTLDTDRECFILDVTLEYLEAGQGFDKDNWPSMADTEWAYRAHAYYQQTPYW
ncbi:MAG TPA: PRC-barrel domain-containing protein [Castellaniella sp.]|nr:PRC-barrel domain-containing protein [Castellaniella sp.]